MEIKELQERVDAWIREYGVRYFSELTNMACLTEEVGEQARVMARKYGDQSFKAGEKENLADEMADVLWVLVCLANQTGVDLTAAVEANFAKRPPATRSVTAATPSYKTPPTAAKPRPEAVKTPHAAALAVVWGISRLWHQGRDQRLGSVSFNGTARAITCRCGSSRAKHNPRCRQAGAGDRAEASARCRDRKLPQSV